MKNLIPSFIQQQFLQQQSHGTLRAYALFVDLSGFTPLTEELMKEGTQGAEQLSYLLNEIFEPLVHLVYERGGFIPYFAGDAFTAIFPEKESGTNAYDLVRTAARARDLFRQRENRFGKYTIGIKFGLSYGTVEWGIVGKKHHSFYFRGDCIDRCAWCQTLARDQHIVVDDVIRERIGGRLFKLEEVGTRAYRIIGNVPLVDDGRVQPRRPAPLQKEVALQFLPEAVVQYSQEGEFRVIISIFLSFEGIDNHDLLNRFATVVLNQIDRFSGYFKEIDFGDKGGVIACFFGAPVSFENNVNRALEFILTVKEEIQPLQEEQNFNVRAGITMGTAFTGIVGGEERCQYACVGNHVNLAARIMTSADWEDILVDGEMQRNRQFRFTHRGDIKYKGIEGNIPTFRLIGRQLEEREEYTGEFVAREEELRQLCEFARPLMEGRSAGLAYVYGEAGIGKSRLTYEFSKSLNNEQPVQRFLCRVDQILRKPFNPFIYFLRNHFGQSPENSVAQNRAAFESRFDTLERQMQGLSNGRRVAAVMVELERTRPILAALLSIPYEYSIWDQLDARGRYQNAIAAVTNLLLAESLLEPVVLEIEDAHWIDDDSLELLRELIRRMKAYPLMILVSSRFNDDGSKPNVISESLMSSRQLPLMEIDLHALPPVAVRTYAQNILGDEIHDEFYELLVRTTNSNPFYLEQVLEYFAESKLLRKQDGKWTIRDKNVKVSGSINAILTARIDRLSNMVRETVKAAAVIGREFEVPILSEVMRSQGELEDGEDAVSLLREQIDTAERGQIWMAMNELRYIFRHSMLREAVYSMQLQARLQQLHLLIAEAIEKLYPDSVAERYVDLAFHYEQAGEEEKTCEYLRKAADYARSNYQNQQALEFYERLLQKLSHRDNVMDQTRTYLKKARVLELIGDWDEAERAVSKALNLAKKSRDVLLLGKANNSLGHLHMLKGDYEKARHFLGTAAGLFESIEDKIGISRVYGNLGHLHFRRAKYDKAWEYFKKSLNSAYAKAGTAASARIVAHLGLTQMNRGRFEEGIEVIRREIPAHEKQQDKQGLATLYTNLGIVYFEKGDYSEALDSYRKGLELAEELGNKQLLAIAVGCIGSVYERQGDYEAAMDNFERDLELCEELGDKQGIAIALGLIGELHSVMGNFDKAISYLQKNLMLCEELEYRKGIAKAVNTLGDIFYLSGQYERSIAHYDRAISMSRTIDNRLVLGYSLVEKGTVLVALEQLEQLQEVEREAMAVAEELGNTDLLAEALLLSARTRQLAGRTPEALQILEQIRDMDEVRDEQLAGVYFEFYQIRPEDEQARRQSLALYEKLYENTPKFIFRERIQQLAKGRPL